MIDSISKALITSLLAGFLALGGCGGGGGGGGGSPGNGMNDQPNDGMDDQNDNSDPPPSGATALEVLISGVPLNLVGAQAYVQAGGSSHRFQRRIISNNVVTNAPTANCAMFGAGSVSDLEVTVTADFGRDIPRNTDDFFSFFTTSPFTMADNLQNAEVQMGVLNFGVGDTSRGNLGEEWSVVPPGNSFFDCRATGDAPDNFPTGDTYIACTAGWTGQMSENFTVARSVGLALFTCVFSDNDTAQTVCNASDCDDGNPCTTDFCTAGGCTSIPNDFQGPGLPAPGDNADVDYRDFFTAASTQCNAGDASVPVAGFCRDGTCQPSPCSDCSRIEAAFDDSTGLCSYTFCNASTATCGNLTVGTSPASCEDPAPLDL